MKLNGAFNKSTSQNDGGFLRKSPLKLDPLKQLEIPGTKAKCLGIEFQENF